MKRPIKDPIQAAWVAGVKYFWNPPAMVALLHEVPACLPQGPPGFHDVWQQVVPLTLVDVWRAENIARRLYEVRALEGDVIECGTYRGGISIMMALLLRHWGVEKKVFMLDSFQGLPRPNPAFDKFHKAGWLVADVRLVEQAVHGAGVADDVEIRKGWFQDTLPTLAGRRWAFAHVDGDLYSSTVTCLAHLCPDMTPGGVVVLDDYNDSGEGVRRAADEYIALNGEDLQLGPIPQAYFRAGVMPARPRKGAVKAGVDELRKNRPYQRMVAEVTRRMADEARALERMRAAIR